MHLGDPTVFEDTIAYEIQRSAIALPFWLAGFGIVCSMIGTLLNDRCQNWRRKMRRRRKTWGSQQGVGVIATVLTKVYFAGVLVVIVSAILVSVLFEDQELAGKYLAALLWVLFRASSSDASRNTPLPLETPTQGIANKEKRVQPLLLFKVWVSVWSASVNAYCHCSCACYMGLYGIAIAAVGILTTWNHFTQMPMDPLRTTLVVLRKWSVACTCGGPNYLKPEVWDNTDALDAMEILQLQLAEFYPSFNRSHCRWLNRCFYGCRWCTG